MRLIRFMAVMVLLMVGFTAWPPPYGKAYGIEVNAFVDRTKISAADSVNLTVVIKDGEGDVDISLIKDFRVVSRGSSSSVRIINTEMSKETNYNYSLLPLKKGDLIIPPLSVEVDGKNYQTNEIPIRVSEAQQMEKDGDSDVFLTASISNNTPFVGQQVTFTVKVFHSVQIANARFQQPEFKGFDDKKVDQDRRYTSVVSSKQYTVIELNYVLIPHQQGFLTIEPAVLSCDIAQPDTRRKSRFDPFFDDPFFSGSRFIPKNVSSEAIEINVQPLPPYSGNGPFSGLVGNFELNAAIDKTQAAVGDSLTLAVAVSGSGNIIDAAEPEMHIPESFKVYKDSPEEKIDFNENGYSGKRTFRWALVPVKDGPAILPAVTYTYFDVTNAQYQVLATEPINIAVTPSTENRTISTEGTQNAAALPKFEKKQVEFVGHDILPIKEDIGGISSRSNLPALWFVLSLVLPIVGYGGIRLYFMSSAKKTDEKALMAQRTMQSLKNAAKPNLAEQDFLSALYSALISAVHSVTGSKGESLTYAETKSILYENGFSQETGDAAAKLLEKIESARYGRQSLSTADKKTLLAETKNMIRRIL